MFTGIIEAVEKVKAVSKDRLETVVPAAWALSSGESVAVNGVCLTVVVYAKGLAVFDISPETRSSRRFSFFSL